MQDTEYHIDWPEGMNPEEYPVRAYNSLFVRASSEEVWQKLIDANSWPDWYENCQKMKILGGETKLGFQTKFKWRTFHVGVLSQVIDFKLLQSLGWDAKEFLAFGYHGWKLIPKDGGTLIVTEEVQGGLVPKIFRKFIKNSLEKEHQKWLMGLDK